MVSMHGGQLFNIYLMRIRKIFTGTMSCNNSMKKIFVKSGMKSEAKFKSHEKMNGRYYDMVYYSIFKKKK